MVGKVTTTNVENNFVKIRSVHVQFALFSWFWLDDLVVSRFGGVREKGSQVSRRT